ncbi:MAG: hypothetical protein JWR85_3816 [Marmoricola sp.]|nr:hypothetical protein [Marmoricola sp.]
MIHSIVNLTTDLERFGVKLPETVLDARATLTEARRVTAQQPLSDLDAEYAAGLITAENVAEKVTEAAGRLASREHNQQALNAIENGCTRTMYAGLRDAGEKILKTLTKPFEDAAAVVQTAGTYFGSDPTPEQIIAGGVPAVAAHEKLGAALNTLNQIRGLRVALADCGYGAPDHGEQDVTWWIAGAKDQHSVDTARRAYSAPGNTFHNLAALGYTLRLNTPAEADRVASGARAATEKAEEAAREAALAEHRESWAPSLAVMAAQAER